MTRRMSAFEESVCRRFEAFLTAHQLQTTKSHWLERIAQLFLNGRVATFASPELQLKFLSFPRGAGFKVRSASGKGPWLLLADVLKGANELHGAQVEEVVECIDRNWAELAQAVRSPARG